MSPVRPKVKSAPDNTKTTAYHITYAPDYRICSIYFWGCNVKCRMCLLKKEAYDCHLEENRLRIYDPDYVSKTPSEFLRLNELTGLLSGLEIKSAFLMGAEPLVDPALPRVLEYLKSVGSRTSLLTNGLKFPPLDLLDEVVFSIKAMTPELHRDYTGHDNAIILKNFREIALSGKVSFYSETVFIPDYVDESEVIRVARFIASVDRNIPFRIDAYLPVPGLNWRAPSVQEIEPLAARVKQILPNTTCFFGDQGKTPLAYNTKRIY